MTGPWQSEPAVHFRFCLLLGCGVVLLAAATGSAEEDASCYPWPFAPQDRPQPVENCFHTILRPEQDRRGSSQGPYFHGGIDIVMPQGTPVLAVAEGTVRIYRESGLDNVVLTEANGDVWEYRHLAPGSAPPSLRVMEAQGRQVSRGTVLGTVVGWSFPEYSHLHLNRRSHTGAILNPLNELIPPDDDLAPEIRGLYLLPNGSRTPFRKDEDGALRVAGAVDIAVDAIDRMKGARFGNPPSRCAWRAQKHGDWVSFEPFQERLPGKRKNPVPRYPREQVNVLYVLSGGLRCRNPIPFDGHQFFPLIITNVDATGRPAPNGSWDTLVLPDGTYTLDVAVWDHSGNRAESSLKVCVTNVDPPDDPTGVPHFLDRLLDEVIRGAYRGPREHAHCFGAVYRGDIVRHTFELENRAPEEPLKVLSVTPGSTGRVVRFDPLIPPQGWATVTVALDTTGLVSRRVDEAFSVELSDGRRESLVLYGEVCPFFHVRPVPIVVRHDRRGTERLWAGDVVLYASAPLEVEEILWESSALPAPLGFQPRSHGAARCVGGRIELPSEGVIPSATGRMRVRVRAGRDTTYAASLPVVLSETPAKGADEEKPLTPPREPVLRQKQD
ncbi:M23 family metallopeptidase [Planctomycetota bacterium]